MYYYFLQHHIFATNPYPKSVIIPLGMRSFIALKSKVNWLAKKSVKVNLPAKKIAVKESYTVYSNLTQTILRASKQSEVVSGLIYPYANLWILQC